MQYSFWTVGTTLAAMIMATVSWRTVSASTPPASAESALREKLGRARAGALDALRDYWMKGEFVQNPDPAGGRGHFILDARQRPCPLAHVVSESGHRDLIERLAAENNGVKVADTRRGPLIDWILRSGLTKEECVLIQQPSLPGDQEVQPEEESVPVVHARLRNRLAVIEAELRAQWDESLDLAIQRLVDSL